ncbi:MAG: hypothetical protein KAT43_02500 [Nanoarchaeota archaeon]|nr:hypothetical protein [Nanoarchaeota archaeon]
MDNIDAKAKGILRSVYGFDKEGTNKLIKEKDKIIYNEILIHPLLIRQIRERQIDNVVELFCLHFLPDRDPDDLLKSFTADLSLPEARFREYYNHMISIDQEVFRLGKNENIPYRDRGEFFSDFYSLALWNRIKDQPAEKWPLQIRSHHEEVKELSLKLIEARGLLDRQILEMVDASIEDILSETAKDPQEIWREYDPREESYSHIYVSKTPMGRRRFMFFVSDRKTHGKIYRTAWKRPDFEQERNCVRIYLNPNVRNQK